ncbi:MAG: glycosyltransferase [Dehalococcoidia bacterium]|nr:glycosyltransferase [Dehalococcoidia bacterium]
MPALDVVIPTCNRQEQLLRCLAALCEQTFGDFGVIVVDDGSDPPVAGGIPAAVAHALALRVVVRANGGPAAARNAGAALSTANVLAFIDDDVEAMPDLLRWHMAALAEGDRRVVFGPLLAPPDWRPTPWNFWEAATLDREYARMARGLYAPTWRQFFTGNAALRRADFLAAGGFDESFTRAEDIELGLRLSRLGCRFVFEPRAAAWHRARRSLASWLAIPRQYARADVKIDLAYPEERWLDVIGGELRERGRLVQLASNATRRLPGGLPAVRAAALASARALFAARRRGSALRALSVVYDLEYRRALASALSAAAS